MSVVLKNVAVNAFASQTLENETWNGMVEWAVEEEKQGKTVLDMKTEIHYVEADMKKMYDVSAMPSAWRSAKSVMLKAVRLGCPLLASNGKPLGKSAVEEQNHITTTVNAAASGSTKISSAASKYIHAATKAELLWAVLTPVEQNGIPHNLRWTH
jgi:hypothetical protein